MQKAQTKLSQLPPVQECLLIFCQSQTHLKIWRILVTLYPHTSNNTLRDVKNKLHLQNYFLFLLRHLVT